MKINGFKHIPLPLNSANGHENGGRFYFTYEEGVKVDNDRKKCTFGVINVSLGDPDDLHEERYLCCVAGKKIFLMLPKVRKGDTNTNALYYGSKYPSAGHAAWSTSMKDHYRENNKAALVDVFVIDAGTRVSNIFGNETVTYVLGQKRITKPSVEPAFIEYANTEAHVLIPDVNITYKELKYGELDAITGEKPKFPIGTVQFRCVIDDSVVKIRPDPLPRKKNAMASVTRALAKQAVIEDDDGE